MVDLIYADLLKIKWPISARSVNQRRSPHGEQGAKAFELSGLGLLACLGRLGVAVLLGQGEHATVSNAVAVEGLPFGRAPIPCPLVLGCGAGIPLRPGAAASFMVQGLADLDARALGVGRVGPERSDKALEP